MYMRRGKRMHFVDRTVFVVAASVEVAVVSDTAAIVVASSVVDDARVVAESLAAPVVEATTDVTAAEAATCSRTQHGCEIGQRTVVEDRDTVASALVVDAKTAVVCKVSILTRSRHTVANLRDVPMRKREWLRH